jgi:hypothetical protein
MKKFLKVLFIILLVIAILIGGFLFLLVGTYERVSRDISHYDEDILEISNAANFMPDLDSLSGYTEIEYTYKVKCYSTFVGFCSDGFALFVTYDDDQYETAKQEALSTYTFLEEPVLRSQDTYELPITEFSYRGYTMKVVPDEDYIDFCACKSFMLLGFNDEEHKIAYLYFYDFDIDYIAEVGEDPEAEMRELVDTAFEWVD